MRLFKSQDLIWILGERKIKIFLISRGVTLWWEKEPDISEDANPVEVEILVGTQEDLDIFIEEIQKAFGMYVYITSGIFTGGPEEVKSERPTFITLDYLKDCLGAMVTMRFPRTKISEFRRFLDTIRSKGYKTFWKYSDGIQIIA